MTKTLAIALLLVVFFAGGCRHRTPPQPPQNLIILLPEEGTTGALVVSNPAGSQTVSQPYSAVTVVRADNPPSAPVRMDPADIDRLFSDTLALLPAAEARFNLYFESGGTVLTPESAAELPKIIEAYRQRKSTDITIVGHTDTVGDTQANYQLGLQRAAQISQELQRAGASASDIFIESHGENDLLVPTPDNVANPQNRRVEVIVR